MQDRPLERGAALLWCECRERMRGDGLVERDLAGDDAPTQVGHGRERRRVILRERDAGVVAMPRDHDASLRMDERGKRGGRCRPVERIAVVEERDSAAL